MPHNLHTRALRNVRKARRTAGLFHYFITYPSVHDALSSARVHGIRDFACRDECVAPGQQTIRDVIKRSYLRQHTVVPAKR